MVEQRSRTRGEVRDADFTALTPSATRPLTDPVLVVDIRTGRPQLELTNGCVSEDSPLVSASAWKHTAKRVLDIIGASLGLFVLSPLILVVALAVKLSSPGPVLYKQTRVGKGGRGFTLYKFRSMRRGAEEELDDLREHNEATGPVFKIRDDPRLSPIGSFLRRSSIDELPQLWNVLRGDMGLVGPRPPVPEEVEHYSDWERQRLAVKPGITCIWQVSGRAELDFETWVRMDLEYIENWSLWLDIKLLTLTIPAVLSRRGAY